MPRQRRRVINRRRSRTPSPVEAPSDYDVPQRRRKTRGSCLLSQFLKIMAIMALIMILFVLPLGTDGKQCSIKFIKDCDLDLYCILCNIYILVLSILVRLSALVEIIFINLHKAANFAKVEISRVLQSNCEWTQDVNIGVNQMSFNG